RCDNHAVHSVPTRRSSDVETGRKRPGKNPLRQSVIPCDGNGRCANLAKIASPQHLNKTIGERIIRCLEVPGKLRTENEQSANDGDRKSTRLNASHVKSSYA